MNTIINIVNLFSPKTHKIALILLGVPVIAVFSIAISQFFKNINKKNYRLLYYCETAFFGIFLILIRLEILLFFAYCLIFIMFILYLIIYGVFSLLPFNELGRNYLALSTLLILVAYLPEIITKVFDLFFRLLKAPEQYSKSFCNFLKKLRLKLWIYFLAFIFVILSTLQDLTEQIFIWKQIEPIIVNSVLTFIAFDGFINLFQSEASGFFKQIKGIFPNKFTNKADNNNNCKK